MGFHSLQQQRLPDDLVIIFKRFTGLLDVGTNSTPPKWHTYKTPQGRSHRRKRGPAFSVRVEKYWNKLQASVITDPNIFKSRLGSNLDSCLTHVLRSIVAFFTFVNQNFVRPVSWKWVHKGREVAANYSDALQKKWTCAKRVLKKASSDYQELKTILQ